MADIDYHCPQCGRARKLSQYADPRGIMCPDCNVPYVAGATGQAAGTITNAAPPGPPERPALKLKHRKSEAPPADPEPPAARGKRKAAKHKPAKQQTTTLPDDVAEAAETTDDEQPVQRAYVTTERRPASHVWIGWLLFAAIGGSMWGLRYGNWFSGEAAGWLSAYGWIVVVAFHVLIVLKAMSDNMLQGILTLLVPGYSLYYIFVVSDDFIMRAVFAGLLVGTGMDAMVEFNIRAQQVMSTVHRFIAEGGGDIR